MDSDCSNAQASARSKEQKEKEIVDEGNSAGTIAFACMFCSYEY